MNCIFWIVFIHLEQKQAWTSEEIKIVKIIQHKKSDKTPSVIYTDLESFIKRIGGHQYNFEILSTTKVGKYIPRRYSVPSVETWYSMQKKHNVWSGEDSINRVRN